MAFRLADVHTAPARVRGRDAMKCCLEYLRPFWRCWRVFGNYIPEIPRSQNRDLGHPRMVRNQAVIELVGRLSWARGAPEIDRAEVPLHSCPYHTGVWVGRGGSVRGLDPLGFLPFRLSCDGSGSFCNYAPEGRNSPQTRSRRTRAGMAAGSPVRPCTRDTKPHPAERRLRSAPS
jgi:hypothetical protein